jgi:HTH-type transcriptional regulator/antitoxin HipB
MTIRFTGAADDIGQAIRDIRRQRGWTQQQLARRAGVTRVFIVELEAGRNDAPWGKVLATLSTLGFTPGTHRDSTALAME